MTDRDKLIDLVLSDIREMRDDIVWIKTHLAERKGERRVALWVASSGGAGLATILAALARHFGL
jgi:hypothetical protein